MFKTRLKHIAKLLSQEEQPSAVLLSSAPARVRSHDQNYPFRQNSNFFYLTGSRAQNSVLVIRPGQAPVLLSTKTTKQQTMWEGRAERLAPIAEKLGAKLIFSRDLRNDALKFLRGARRLYFDNQAGALSFEIAQTLLRQPLHRASLSPWEFVLADQLLAPMRLIKDKQELDNIRQAAKITSEALHAVLPQVKAGTSEAEIAAHINHNFALNSAEPAFGTIVAAGQNATTLHHRASSHLLRAGDLVLIDFGAERNLYSADISRTLPVSGLFDDAQAEIYELVLKAQKAAIRKMRPGFTLRVVHQAASDTLISGLLQLKLLRGTLKNHITKQTIRRYFPHGIGHPLGLDVHDVHPLGSSLDLKLQPGMVLTVEPGLYFPTKLKRLKPLGIRIEDDILITRGAPEILTSGFPREIAEIETLMR